MKKYYAHSLKGETPEHWQPLDEHLRNVAEMAAGFAHSFQSEDWVIMMGGLYVPCA